MFVPSSGKKRKNHRLFPNEKLFNLPRVYQTSLYYRIVESWKVQFRSPHSLILFILAFTHFFSTWKHHLTSLDLISDQWLTVLRADYWLGHMLFGVHWTMPCSSILNGRGKDLRFFFNLLKACATSVSFCFSGWERFGKQIINL